MKTIQISKSVEKELETIPKWKVMLYLQEKEAASVYQMAKDLDWSTGKTHAVINSLLKSAVIKSKTVVKNGRATKLVRLAE